MTNKHDELINAFETKLRKLISEYESLREQNEQLEAALEREQKDSAHAQQQFLEIRNNYYRLRVARNLGVTEEERVESKRRINKIVREIDKCLALLNE
jgi:multidrug resistance efflux pump